MTKNINDLYVAMVLNDYQVVLNAGKSDGVETGYSYLIYEVGQRVIDPISGEDLGNLEIVKGRVWIHQVADSHCVAGSDPDPEKVSHLARRSISITINKNLGDVKVKDRAKRVS
ncbi:hypothetical protein V7S57_21030 [Caulobacter sp. CCNWLY153]|uniref:hypothetical protein n=1 Tax=unclassified Caulobacter TaxID=2648921 RepID=UPI002FEEE01C